MVLRHDDVNTGDYVYSVHHDTVFRVAFKDKENLLIKRLEGDSRNPQHLLSPIGGIHYGLESYSHYKDISRLVDSISPPRRPIF